MPPQVIHTDDAPAAVGTYSQAVRHGDFVYLSGQIGLVPGTTNLADGGFASQAHQVFRNLSAVAAAAGSDLGASVKLTIYLIDFANFPELNEIMSGYFDEPYPARATVQVSALPLGAEIEIDAVLGL